MNELLTLHRRNLSGESVDPALELLLHGEDMVDSSKKGIVLTNNGATIVSGAKFGKAIYNNTSTGNIQFPWASVFTPTQCPNGFTLDFWCYMISNAGGYASVFGHMQTGLDYWSFGMNGNTMQFYYWDGSGHTLNGPSVPYKEWHHFALTVDSSKTARIFLDGVKCGEVAGIAINANTAGASVMSLFKWSNVYSICLVDELRVLSRCAWTSNFTVPSRPYPPASRVKEVPDEYTAVEYIENASQAYINTGVVPDTNTKLEIDFQITTAPAKWLCIFGSYNPSYANSFTVWCDPNGVFRADYLSDYDNFSSAIATTGRHVLVKQGYMNTIDGTYTVNNSTGTLAGSTTITICAGIKSGALEYPTNMRVYGCKIWDSNGFLIRDFVPVKTSAGVYGLWDKSTRLFYGSGNSYAFTGN